MAGQDHCNCRSAESENEPRWLREIPLALHARPDKNKRVKRHSGNACLVGLLILLLIRNSATTTAAHQPRTDYGLDNDKK